MNKKKLNIKKMAKKWNVLFSPCVKEIYKIKTEDIPFSIVVNRKCENCGGYKRKISCPPFALPYYKWRERVRKYKYAYIIISKADGTVMIYDKGDPRREKWIPHPEYFGHALVGVNMSLQTYIYKKMLEMKKNIIGSGRRSIVFVAGPCHRCRKCNIGGRCIHGINNISLEGAGVSVYGMLDNMGIEYEAPAIKYLTMVTAVVI